MTAPVPPDPPGAFLLYRGEVAPRRPAVAAALSLLMPGLGHIYAGRPVLGLGRSLVLFVGAWSLISAWRALHFVPHLPLLWAAVAATVFVVANARDAARIAREEGQQYVLRPYNRPLVYGALAVALHVGPWTLLAVAVESRLATVVRVGDAAMFPMVFKGDTLLVDRSAYRRRPPAPGDVVVLEGGPGRAPLVRRVVGTAGDAVSIEDNGHLVLNGEFLERRLLGRLSIPGAGDDDETTALALPRNWGTAAAGVGGGGEEAGAAGEPEGGDHLIGHLEFLRGRSWTVTHRPTGYRQDIGPVVVPPGELYVLGDNRDNAEDSRHFGTVEVGRVVGRPVCVAWSRHPVTAAWRLGRAGLPVR